MSGCLRIFDTNYIDQDLLANYSVSSEQTSFPVENAFNNARRSKVWRSNGYFKITAGSNDVLIINEGGPNLTATIAAGEYSTTALFMAAVKTALDDAGALTYTVTQNSNLRFVIAATGTFSLICSSVSFTARTILGFDSTDRTGAATYTAQILRVNTGEWILWDMGLSSKPSAFAMTGPRNSPLKLSPSGVFKLSGNHTNSFGSPAYQVTLDYNDEVMTTLSDTVLYSDALRFWRLDFTDQNPNGYVEIGAFFLGTYFSPERGRAQFPFTSKYIDRSENVTSEGGQTYSDIFEQTQSFGIDWFGLEKGDIETITDIFRKYGKHTSFFVSFDTNEVFSTQSERMTKLVKFASEPDYQLISPNNFKCGMDFLEEI